ncbi:MULTISPECIES: hypothetical protein [unclassified Rhodococcus (in: high G+C Gram-positive bacteria)]|uniref:hypothetical protein n=1 Tax=unclassified Rhodococcus (in: high G+C Gram-positive bacteria) TaxID=192944 RepID=UPI000E0B10D4|nr:MULTISPECIES: hypothetical protein [unclassified Rhodococcus (in: high G+C Gram-positive bacteria)]QKT11691.1 hypothetical protein HUN07_13985 [Rhodococcus sp. W8901]RDI23279.1 hypothetical protein DEU38_112143 [Rhodococcus sp. AG1013]
MTIDGTQDRWSRHERRALLVLRVSIGVFTYGTVVHILQILSAPADPYPTVPTWLAVFFTSLVVLDPMCAILLWWRHRAGVVIGAAVLSLDAIANAYANYFLDNASGLTIGRVAPVPIALLALLLAYCGRVHWSRLA